MKQLILNYAFSVSAKTITCGDFSSGHPLYLGRILVIADATTNKTLWSPVDATLSTATVTSSNVITLSTLQGGESNSDSLLIYYETSPGDPNYSGNLPVADAAAEASLSIIGTPIINKAKCASGTLTATTPSGTLVLIGGDTFTANEIEIANVNGAGALYGTLDGTPPGTGGFSGTINSTDNTDSLATLVSGGILTLNATTASWPTSGVITVVCGPGGTGQLAYLAYTGTSGSTLTGLSLISGTGTWTVLTNNAVVQVANFLFCIPSVGAEILPCNTSSPNVQLFSPANVQYAVSVRGT